MVVEDAEATSFGFDTLYDEREGGRGCKRTGSRFCGGSSLRGGDRDEEDVRRGGGESIEAPSAEEKTERRTERSDEVLSCSC